MRHAKVAGILCLPCRVVCTACTKASNAYSYVCKTNLHSSWQPDAKWQCHIAMNCLKIMQFCFTESDSA